MFERSALRTFFQRLFGLLSCASVLTSVTLMLVFAVAVPMAANGQDASSTGDETQRDASNGTTANKPATVEADGNIVAKFAPKLDAFNLLMDGSEAAIKQSDTSDARLKEMPTRLEDVRKDIRTFLADLKPLRKQSSERLVKIGPAPKEGEPAEAEDIANERRQIAAQVAAYDSLIKNAELLDVRAVQVTDGANSIRRSRFSNRILSPVDNFYDPALWSNALSEVGRQVGAGIYSLREAFWSVSMQKPVWGLLTLLLPLSSGFLLWWIERRARPLMPFKPLTDDDYPTRYELGALATFKIVRRSVPVVGGLTFAYLLSLRFDLFQSAGDEFLFNSISALCFAWILWVANHQLFLPSRDKERLVSGDRAATERVGHILSVMIFVWLLDALLANLDAYLRANLVVTVVRSLTAALSIAVLIFLMLRIKRRTYETAEERRYNAWPLPLVLFLDALIVAICIACLLGYVALGRFVGMQVIATGGIGLLMYLSHLGAEHLSNASLKAASDTPPTTADSGAAISASTLRIIGGLSLDLLILLIGIPAILLQWGFDWTEVRGWLLAAFFGFQIGDYTISIQSVLVAIALLVGGVLLTRLVQGWFLKRSDVALRSDTGVRESIHAGLGYIGFALSAIAGVSYLGINFANLAIIAGALSVGIGFGLQSIVNNFVSGLILLVERPVKSGDWISVGESDGLVRRISVRATELETLDKQSIIVPNSELISKPVTNWMYKERIGRINVSVGVSYEADVDVVERVLLEAAKGNRFVLSRPAPNVIFDDFGDSSLDFLLRVFITDMEHKAPAASSLRFSIWRSLKDAGIEIPFPQRDIHIKDMEEIGRHVENARLKITDGEGE